MIANAWDAILQAWMRFWFQERSTTPLEIIRIGIGSALLINYGLFGWEELLELYGDTGVLPQETVIAAMQNPWAHSLLYYFSESWQLYSFYWVFLASCLMLVLGWHTGVVKWLVFIGQLSLAYRNPAATYGVDAISISILFILCLAPIGKAISLDRARHVRKALYAGLENRIVVPVSRWGFACTRLIQIQMVVLFFFSAAEKLYGDAWWYGDAVWMAITNHQTAFAPVGFLAENYWLINLATYGTVLLEFAYVFLIWGRETRPYLLVAVIGLHLSFVFFLGLYFFSSVMIVGHLSFLRHRWLHDWDVACKERLGEVAMIYDQESGFCRRSMAWLLAFDGLKQIHLCDNRLEPSSAPPAEGVDEALILVRAEGPPIPGFYAYRYAVRRACGGCSRFSAYPW